MKIERMWRDGGLFFGGGGRVRLLLSMCACDLDPPSCYYTISVEIPLHRDRILHDYLLHLVLSLPKSAYEHKSHTCKRPKIPEHQSPACSTERFGAWQDVGLSVRFVKCKWVQSNSPTVLSQCCLSKRQGKLPRWQVATQTFVLW